MTKRIFIGVDDTDFGESIGTGALARELKLHLERKLGVSVKGITRHQLLVHPDVPYTSHNSSACLELAAGARLPEVALVAERFISFLFHPGADPGLCVASEDQLTQACLDFAARAQTVVVKKQEALELAANNRILLKELGGEGIGVIGALAACALRAGGDDGRFISLRGIKDFEGLVSVRDILEGSDIDLVLDEVGPLSRDRLVETRGWVRPELSGGKAVLKVVDSGPHHEVTAKKKHEKTFEK